METVSDVLSRAQSSQLLNKSIVFEPSTERDRSLPTSSRPVNDACPDCRGIGFYTLDVPYWDVQFGKPQPCPTCHDGQLARRLSEMSQLIGELQDARLNNLQIVKGIEQAFSTLRDWCHEPRGFVTLWGGYGCGKTRLLASVVNELNATCVGAVYYTLPELLDLLRQSVGENAYNKQHTRILRVRVLAIDEVDPDRINLTNWAREELFKLVDARYRLRHQQGTLCATNIRPNRDDDALGYVYSRMTEGTLLHITAADMRPHIGRGR